MCKNPFADSCPDVHLSEWEEYETCCSTCDASNFSGGATILSRVHRLKAIRKTILLRQGKVLVHTLTNFRTLALTSATVSGASSYVSRTARTPEILDEKQIRRG
jgi:hypothetical protein